MFTTDIRIDTPRHSKTASKQVNVKQRYIVILENYLEYIAFPSIHLPIYALIYSPQRAQSLPEPHLLQQC